MNIRLGGDCMEQLLVFLDTNEYKRCGHNFSSTPFKKVKELCANGKISLISTNVVIGEVSQHIKDDVENFAVAQRNLAQKAGAIRNILTMQPMIAKFDNDEVEKLALSAFMDFLDETNCKVLSSNGINNDNLINDYFNKNFPFEDNKKKGDEFKDAFIVYALKKYIEENDQKLIIISNDHGFCSSFIGDSNYKYFQSSEEFFAFLNRKEEISSCNLDYAISYIDSKFEELSEKFEDAILSEGLWVQEAIDDIDVETIEIESIHVMYIDDVSDEMVTIHMQITATIDVEFDLLDEANSYWDKEEGKYLFSATERVRVKKEIQVSSILEVSVDANDESLITTIIDYEYPQIKDSRYGVEIFIDFDDDEIEVVSTDSDDEEYLEGAYTECPDCGKKINIDNDGGNGFCIDCASKH